MGCCPVCETDNHKCTCGEMFKNKQILIDQIINCNNDGKPIVEIKDGKLTALRDCTININGKEISGKARESYPLH